MLALGGLVAMSCRDNVADPQGAPLDVPTIHAVEADLLVPHSVFHIVGDGFLAPPVGTTTVELSGRLLGESVRQQLVVSRVHPTRIELRVDTTLTAFFGRTPRRFQGDLIVRVQPSDVDPLDPRVAALVATARVDLQYRPWIEPALTSIAQRGGAPQASIAPGELLKVRGDGFVDDEEGETELLISGRYVRDRGGEMTLDAVPIPLRRRIGRTTGIFYLRPSLFTLDPGTFRGQLQLVTRTPDDARRFSAPLTDVTLHQTGPVLDRISPRRAARGQIVSMFGHGLLPNDGAAQTASIVVAEGMFYPHDGSDPLPLRGPNAFEFVPEVWLDNREARVVLRTRINPITGELDGLGAIPGRFDGTFTLVVMAGLAQIEAPPLPVEFYIEPPTQAVNLRYLPGFGAGLAQFGLEGAEVDVRRRILDVCRRDYAGLRVEFSEVPPPDWAEFVTVEIGGRDPNGLGLFGLDNTPTKDEGNIVLDELLGGRNAETEAAGDLPYGGVFVESFLALSPTHPDATYIASPWFDTIYAPLSPALSGDAAEPYRPGDPLSPDRAERVRVASFALGSLVGSTITHEVGHALGLAAVQGDVHNPFDTDGGLMDRGEDRPFLERAELNGSPPAAFIGPNRAYLEALFGE